MNLQFDRRDDPNLEALVGTWRRFGPSGPAYEIVGPVSADEHGRLALKVKVAETAEEIDYPVDYILDDPKET